MLWVDDFSADHFADGRYTVWNGIYLDTFVIDHGLRRPLVDPGHEILYAGWSDPSVTLGQPVAAYVESIFTDWSMGDRLTVGFAEPVAGSGIDPQPGVHGLWGHLAYIAEGTGSPDGGLVAAAFEAIIVYDGDTRGFIYTSEGTMSLPTGLITLRLSLDISGRVVLGLGGQYFAGATFYAENLGLTADLTADELAAIADCVPVGAVSGGGGDVPGSTEGVLNEWRYATYGASTPGEMSIAAGANGILRAGPAPATPGLRGHFQ